MPKDSLTGSRIRERRVAQGLKQADLARAAGISASYLNLIEHNRRRIGGKLLLEIAQVLQVEPTQLTEGAGAALVSGLREAALGLPQVIPELDRADEFAGRFPGWAELLVATRARVTQLERNVEVLTDRMTHDPHLAASLHEMLSTVTAIRSAASILAEPGEIDPDWQARFHRNIYEDSARLAETSRGLVTYLEADDAEASGTGAPQEEFETVLEAAGHHVAELEANGSVERAAQRLSRGRSAGGSGGLSGGLSGAARSLLLAWLTRYAEDARVLPLAQLVPAIKAHGPDPVALARTLGADPARVMRRLAAMRPEVLPDTVGLAICDGSGVLSYRKPLPDFPMPRFGAACPLWPLYRALNRPLVVLAGAHVSAGRSGTVVWTEAWAAPAGGAAGGIAVNTDPLYEAHMLVRALPKGHEVPPVQAQEVGVACRVCPRENCHGRREPSMLATQ